MKHFILTALILITCSGWSQTNHKQVEVVKIAPKEENCIEIPSFFSQKTISETNVLNELLSKKIKRVELIYTRFNESPDFDQVQLNEDRMNSLNQLLPGLKNDHPEIVWIEQTGATVREEAVSYFHGFRIYTDDESTKEGFTPISKKSKSLPFSMFDINNSKGGTFSHPSGTLIHIPTDAVVTADGQKVIGIYTLTYREYRDTDEKVYSIVPHPNKTITGYYQFNSAWIYEIFVTRAGPPLKLQKEVIVDFNNTEKKR